jgi:ABC-type glycerol-3-phosphate transport system substrate-binding protein
VTFSKYILFLGLSCLLCLSGCKPATEEVCFMAYFPTNDASEIKGILENFIKENPNIKIQLTLVPNAEKSRTEWENRKKSGKIPDVWIIPDQDVKALSEQKALHEFSTTEIHFQSEIIPELTGLFTVGNHQFGIPINWSTEVLFYNKTIFQKHGIPLPADHWDWSDLLACVEKLTIVSEDTNEIIQSGIDLSTKPEVWLPFLFQNNGEVQTEDGHWVLNTPQYIQSNIEGLDFYRNLFTTYSFKTTSNQNSNSFLHGKSALIIAPREFAKNLSQQSSFDWDICSIPKGKKKAAIVTSNALAISSQTKHLKASLALVNFLISEINQSTMTLNGSAPSFKSLLSSRLFIEFPRKNIQSSFFTQALKTGKRLPMSKSPMMVDKSLREEISSMVSNPIRDTREVIETMQVRLEEMDLALQKQ